MVNEMYLNRTRKFLREERLLIILLFVFLLVGFVFYVYGSQLDVKERLTAFVNFLGFFGVGATLYVNNKNMRMEFVRDYISKFFIRDDLSSIFYDLVQEYPSEIWEQVCCEELGNRDLLKSNSEVLWDRLDAVGINKEREVGKRYYHPEYFQGSLEEQRLDRLLGYFDVIAFHVNNGEISIDDVKSIIGYQLYAVATSPVIERYLSFIKESWEVNPRYRIRYGDQLPYRHLRGMLEELKRENKSVIFFKNGYG
jgi:hypothetical protein